MNQEINQFNLNAGLLNKYKNLLYFNTHWHKIVVENVEGLDRDAVLGALMKCCSPLHFIPVRYECSDNTASFLLKNCGAAIQKFCNQNLIVVNPYNKDKPFKIAIKLCFASVQGLKINIQNNVMNVLNRRFNNKTGVLNLENFAKDTELQEYCALCQPKLLLYVLDLAKDIYFRSLKLSHNDIEFLKPLEVLQSIQHNIAIDLRNNNIKDVSELESMKQLNIKELWLDGNPLCDKYNEITYAKSVGKQLEKLEKLDGVNIQWKGFLPFRRNFLCNLTGFDLVDQFLEHYFTLYDAQNRSVLEAVYHEDALFSLTSLYLPSQSTSTSAKLAPYKKVSRNLKQMSDYSKNAQCLFSGTCQIVNILNTLPVTEHDPYSFTVDLVMYTETTAVLVVCGVFRECAESLLESDRLLSFTRTFVLLAGQDGEYSIINDMVHITNATTSQATRAFKQVKLPKPRLIYLPQAQNDKEKHDMSVALKAITGLELVWARKCLEECNCNMKEALALFIDLYKIDKIPRSAFVGGADPGDVGKEENHPKLGTQAMPNPSSSVKRPYVAPPMLFVQTSIEPRTAVTYVGNAQPNIHYIPVEPASKKIAASSLGMAPTWNNLTDKRETSKKPHDVVECRTEPSSKRRHTAGSSRDTAPDSNDLVDKRNASKKPQNVAECRREPTSKRKQPAGSSRHMARDPNNLTDKRNTSKKPQDVVESRTEPSSKRKQSAGSSRDMAPDRNDMTDKGNTSKKPHAAVECIDLVSSPEQGTTQVSTEEAFILKHLEIFKRNPMDVKGQERLLYQLQHAQYLLDLKQLQQSVRDGIDSNDIYRIASTLLHKYFDKYNAYEEVFDLLYRENIVEARKLMAQKLKSATHNKRQIMNKAMIELLAARFEYLYGSERAGENKIKKIIAARPLWQRPALDYCRALLKKKKFDEAKAIIAPFKGTMNTTRMLKQVKLLEEEYEVELWN